MRSSAAETGCREFGRRDSPTIRNDSRGSFRSRQCKSLTTANLIWGMFGESRSSVLQKWASSLDSAEQSSSEQRMIVPSTASRQKWATLQDCSSGLDLDVLSTGLHNVRLVRAGAKPRLPKATRPCVNRAVIPVERRKKHVLNQHELQPCNPFALAVDCSSALPLEVRQM